MKVTGKRPLQIAGCRRARKRKQAIAAYASMIGAPVLARVADDAALSVEVLETVAATLASLST